MQYLVCEALAFKALASEDIFAFYQPVVDRNRRTLGYELMMRWQIGDKILSPAAFMSGFHSVRLWQQLTEMMVHSALNNILRLPGDCTFAINLPGCLLYEESIKHILRLVQSRQLDKAAMSRLIFEINERTTLTEFSQGARAINILRGSGCRVYMDDCFSETSVIFPVKNIQLDGFKIDKSIVDTFQGCAHHEYIIRTLIYFCSLTQSACIAEGVDTQDKFDALAALGVNEFQGYLTGKPGPLSLGA